MIDTVWVVQDSEGRLSAICATCDGAERERDRLIERGRRNGVNPVYHVNAWRVLDSPVPMPKPHRIGGPWDEAERGSLPPA